MLSLLLTLSSMFCAVVPIVSFLGVMWWLDRYDREPVWLVGLTFLWGAVGAVFLALIGNFLGAGALSLAFGAEAAGTLSPVIVAPLVEEPTKALVLFLVVRSRAFDNMTDGFVYGAAAGLGFGMTENFLYFTDVGASGDVYSWMMTVLIRTFFSALMHGCATSCVGAALGFAHLRSLGWTPVALIVGFGAAMGMHALWNGLIVWGNASDGSGQFMAMDLILFPIEFLILALIYQGCLLVEAGIIRTELGEEAAEGLLPAAHVPILASALRRTGRSWLPRAIPQIHYVRVATALAFRKNQARRARGRRRDWYAGEVSRLRGELSGLLSLASARLA